MRVSLVDPGSVLPWYNHALASALGQRNVDTTIIASRFKFTAVPEPDGYRRREAFYPLTYRIFRRSRMQKPFKAAEHALGLAAVRAIRCDVLHVQWSWWPELDSWALPVLRKPSVLTAHDILPQRGRLADKPEVWRDFVRRFDAVIVHSPHGKERLISEVGVRPEVVHVIPHPVYVRPPRYEGDGRTVLTFGVLQRYKQVEHSVAMARELGIRLEVMGDPIYNLDHLRQAPEVDWRLGYATEEQLDDALARATVTVFPYKQELDQSGALHRALGAGVPAVVYDVGGLREPILKYGAGVVVPADDQAALARAVASLLDDPVALERAREGARRCARELSWASAAGQHVEVYRNLLAG